MRGLELEITRTQVRLLSATSACHSSSVYRQDRIAHEVNADSAQSGSFVEVNRDSFLNLMPQIL